MESTAKSENQDCPICGRLFNILLIEQHVNKCIFLNSSEDSSLDLKRKRSPSPSLISIKSKPSTSSNNYKNTSETKNGDELKYLSSLTIRRTKTKNEFESNHNETEKEDFSFLVPLAKKVQPKSIDDFIGQNHVFGKNTVLRTLLEKGEIPNMILWGPPGSGKTSLAEVVKQICKNDPKKLKYSSLCAANAGVKEVQSIVTIAKNDLKFGKRTILFMDEIHRFNKKQQDTFLTHVEKGEIILIGATTENPSFSINSALLSRCRVIVFEKLGSDSLLTILLNALISLNISVIDDDNISANKENQKFPLKLQINKSAVQWLADISDGDARIALTNLQLVIQHHAENKKVLSIEDIKNGIKKSHMLYDRRGEEHYNLISALHKSIRGSDENASLYWLSRMVVSGEDPLFIARRLVRAASEDIGNADPNALQLAVSTMQGCQLLGLPDCDVLLAQCAIYLARAPKSREADSALASAKQLISECKGAQPNVPLHIRNVPTKLMRNLGYGKRDHLTEMTFMPPEYKDVDFFS